MAIFTQKSSFRSNGDIPMEYKMRSNLILFSMFTIFLLIGCQSDIAVPQNSWGYFKADVNGRRWAKTFKNAYQAVRGSEDYPDSLNRNKISVYSLLFDHTGSLQEQFYFENIPLKPGRYKILHTKNPSGTDSISVSSSLTTFIDYDVFRDEYEVLNSESNYLQIDQYQVNGNREIKGRFNVTFILKSKREFNSYDDTLRFTNGSFHTKILPRSKRLL